MKKRKILFACMIVVCLILAVCAVVCQVGNLTKPGNAEQCQTVMEATELYTEEEIQSAFAAVKRDFSRFTDCTLHELRYNDEECVYLAESYAESQGLDVGNVIAVRGELTAGKKQLSHPYILPGWTYEDYIWILTRKEIGSEWTVADAYG